MTDRAGESPQPVRRQIELRNDLAEQVERRTAAAVGARATGRAGTDDGILVGDAQNEPNARLMPISIGLFDDALCRNRSPQN